MTLPSAKEFGPGEFEACWRLIRMGMEEDLGFLGDRTSNALIPATLGASARYIARQSGVLAGIQAVEMVTRTLGQTCKLCGAPMCSQSAGIEFYLQCTNSKACQSKIVLTSDQTVRWENECGDGQSLRPGQVIARVSGPLRALLACERLSLNILQRLSGVATLTRQFVDAVAGLNCAIYDTRKTTPGWRVVEKYAVRVGGGQNHRMGLFDAVLVKDNHIAAWRSLSPCGSLAEVVRTARMRTEMSIELEVESIGQLQDALSGKPDSVLLDNMTADQIREAVALRDKLQPGIVLEASGGITLRNVRLVAETGVDRISVGALTHSAPSIDFSMELEDWT